MRTVYLLMLSLLLPLFVQSQSQIFLVGSGGGLFLVDVEDCSSELIGTTNVVFVDIAINPIGNSMYGIGADGNLYSINTSNADITLIGFTDYGFTGMTFSAEGVLLAMKAGVDLLYEVNTTTGEITSLGSTGLNMGSGGDLTFINGDLYVSTDNNSLAYIDMEGLSNSSVIGPFTGLFNVFGVTTIGGCQSGTYIFAGSAIYLLDLSEGDVDSELQCAGVIGETIFGAASISESEFVNTEVLGEDSTLCLGDSIFIDATTEGANYLWSDGSTGPTNAFYQEGSYWLEVIIPGCTFTDTIHLYPPDELNAAILPPDTSICEGGGIVLQTLVEGLLYEWNTGSSSQSIMASNQGWYWVESSWEGCSVRDSLYLRYLDEGCESMLEYPNVFTPNSDGQNDRFTPIVLDGVVALDLKIFNRWGQMVYQSSSLVSHWDGKDMNGKELPESTYYYVVQYDSVNQKQERISDYVTLLR